MMNNLLLQGITGQLFGGGGGGCASPVLGSSLQVGTGTSNASYAPIYGLYDYSWYGMIFEQSEMGSGKQITGIEVETRGYTNPYIVNNQTIKIYNVVETIFDSTPAVDLSDLTISNETIVKANFTFTIGSSGFQTINFDENFCYDGVSNILISWENRDGTWQSGFGNGEYAVAISKASYKATDDNYPTGNGTRTNGRINTKFKY
jgi:hypothetical protein